MGRILDFIDRIFTRIESTLIITLMLIATILGILQIVLRYVFNSGIGGLENFFVLATTAAMLLAGSRAVRDDKHVRVELLALVSSPRIQHLLQITSNLLGLILCGFLFYACITFTDFTYEMETIALETGLADWVISLIATMTLGMFAIRYLIRLIRSFYGTDVPLHTVPITSAQDMEGLV